MEFYKIKVVGYVERKWYSDIKSHWKLCVYGNQPLFTLSWNLTGYLCIDLRLFGNKFKFSMQLGRQHMSSSRNISRRAAFQY